MEGKYFIMCLWQTGNVGSHNIKKSHINPENGFESYEEAEEFLNESFKDNNPIYIFSIMKLYYKL